MIGPLLNWAVFRITISKFELLTIVNGFNGVAVFVVPINKDFKNDGADSSKKGSNSSKKDSDWEDAGEGNSDENSGSSTKKKSKKKSEKKLALVVKQNIAEFKDKIIYFKDKQKLQETYLKIISEMSPESFV